MPPQESGSAPARATLDVLGMHCASCVANVEAALKAAPGVRDVAVNLATEQATITFDPVSTTPDQLAKAVSDAGYEARTRSAAAATLTQSPVERSRSEMRKWRARAAFGVALAFPVAVLGMFVPGRESGLAQAVLTTILQATLGLVFIRGSLRAARHARADMDSLIALGTTTAWAYSLWTLWAGHEHFFFDTAATILALIAVGKWLESRARSAATSAVTSLLDLSAPTATLIRNGQEAEVSAADLHPGDVVLVRPGGRLPADGLVESGETTIDESLLTGEAMPVARAPGHEVVGGSINLTGAIHVRITRTGAATIVGQMASLVESALATKTGAQRLADRIAGVFVPIVCGVALATLLGWGLAGFWENGLHAAIAVLIVACPCALGLATPAAVMVGCAVGARRGVLIRSSEVLERIGRLNTVVLDKTGTMTIGRPTIARIVSIQAGVDEAAVIRLAAAVEQLSEHPLAKAVTREAALRAIQVPVASGFVNHAGGGVQAIVDGRIISVSKLADSDPFPAADELRAEGMTLSGVYEGGANPRLLGVLAFSDELKPGARDAVVELQQLGLETILLTGDHPAAAQRIGQLVGIQNVIAGVSPQGKLDCIRDLQSRGDAGEKRSVAMVGDGINDAAALAQADVGIAMGGGADIAKEAGDVVLVGGDPSAIPRAIRLSLAMRRRIRLGLLWAFIYNVALIPLAVAGLLHPMLAAAAMSISSASVVGNALLLLRFDRKRR
ncbi:MAG: cadmium-translocating P-type ATPase [Phycisphaeraceae bacterium]|nr:cadmium-translocating P-type ATPase [Phycisphaeraceae bacterium]